jgi:hypothetical protein
MIRSRLYGVAHLEYQAEAATDAFSGHRSKSAPWTPVLAAARRLHGQEAEFSSTFAASAASTVIVLCARHTSLSREARASITGRNTRCRKNRVLWDFHTPGIDHFQAMAARDACTPIPSGVHTSSSLMYVPLVVRTDLIGANPGFLWSGASFKILKKIGGLSAWSTESLYMCRRFQQPNSIPHCAVVHTALLQCSVSVLCYTALPKKSTLVSFAQSPPYETMLYNNAL